MGLTVLIGFGAVSLVHAQTATTMPVLYNQSGTAVNTSSGYLPVGTYYLAGGTQIQYYGNGTFYNPSIQQYGGSIYNSNGTAGASLGYTVASSGYQGALMPALFNQSGSQVNMTNSYLSAGYYYTANNPSMGIQVQYYGNGTYYNPNIRQYGGSVTNPNGTAGVSLGYAI